MNTRSIATLSVCGVFLILAVSCARSPQRVTDPVNPSIQSSAIDKTHQRFLFGLWDISLNRESGKFEAVPMRSATFHVNVVGNMQSMSNLVVTISSEDYVTGRFDLNVTLTHPYPNTNMRGFDVRGTVFGNMSAKDDPDILSAKDDPDLLWMGPNGFRLLNPDGWTRWWNPLEFTTAGLFGYTEAIFGTKGFICPATLNPYKYFANCLNATSPVVPAVNSTNRGTFATDEGPVTRQYELVFPLLDNGFPDARFQYAIDASWAPPTGGGSVPGVNDFPPEANCAEPFYVNVDSSESTAYYINNTDRGGDLTLKIEVFDWGAPYEPSGVDDEIEAIKIESPTLFGGVVSVPIQSSPGSSNLSAIYDITVPVVPTGLANQQILVTIVSAGNTYEPPASGPDYPAGKKLSSYALKTVRIRNINPIIVGNIATDGQVIDIEARGYINYLLDTVDGLQIMNVINPESPYEMNSVALPVTPKALDVENGYAFVIDSGSNLQIVDVDPVIGASIVNTIPMTGTLTSIDVDGSYAYIGNSLNTVLIYDIDPPESAYMAGSVVLNGPGPIADIAVRNGYAYVAADDLEIFDVDPPGSAAFVSSVPTTWLVVTVDVADTGYAFMGDSSHQFQVVDIETPGSASVVDTLMLGGQINDLVSTGNMSFVTVSGIGLDVVVFDTSASQAVEVADLSIPKTAGAISVQDNMAYIDGDVVIVQLWEGDQQNTGWAQTWGGTALDQGYSVAVDSAGNVYHTGWFDLTADFDPGPGVDIHTSNGTDDIYLSKFDSMGNFLWARTWGGITNDRGDSVAVDSSGNVYVTGFYQITADFNPGSGVDIHTSNGDGDAFLSKLDSEGNFIWAKTWGGSNPYPNIGNEECWGVAVDSSGNVCVTGIFMSPSVDFDPGAGVDNHSLTGFIGSFLSTFDSSGNFLWAETWCGSSTVEGLDVTVDNFQNIYVTGWFFETVDFDPGGGVDNHTVVGSSDAYLSSFDSSGNFLWAETWGGTGDDQGLGTATDGTGNVYVTGYFASSADFDPGSGVDNHNALGMGDVFLSKLDSSGNFVWAKTWGGGNGTAFDQGNGVTVDNEGNVFVTGVFLDVVDFDPGGGVDDHTSNGLQDVFLSKFDSSGNLLWAKTWGGTDHDYGYSVAMDGSLNVYATGSFGATVDFDPGPGVDNHTSNGDYDTFLSKFLPDGNW